MTSGHGSGGDGDGDDIRARDRSSGALQEHSASSIHHPSSGAQQPMSRRGRRSTDRDAVTMWQQLAPTFFWNRSGGRQSRFCRKWALRTLRTRCLRRRTSSCSACAWRTLASGVNGASSSCASDAGVVSGTVRRPELLSRSDLRIDIITCIHVHENKIIPCLLTVKRLGV